MSENIRNILTILGNRDEINRFEGLVRTEISLFDFDKILPMPEERELVKMYKNYPDDPCVLPWYRWRSSHWGNISTAKNIYMSINMHIIDIHILKQFLRPLKVPVYQYGFPFEELKGKESEANIIGMNCVFDTDLNPPVGIYIKLRELFPTLIISWYFSDFFAEIDDGIPNADEEFRESEGYLEEIFPWNEVAYSQSRDWTKCEKIKLDPKLMLKR
jgi:hypothetical protein